MNALKRKRPTVEGRPGAYPKVHSRAQSDSAIIPLHDARVTRFRDYLTLATNRRIPRAYPRRKGGAK